MLTYEPVDMKVTGFGGTQLNLRRFEENGKSINIDAWGLWGENLYDDWFNEPLKNLRIFIYSWIEIIFYV